MMFNEFEKGFESTVLEFSLIVPDDRILVAVSGGLDSMALLHCLVEFSAKYRLTLAVAHINHQLRGREAALDEQFVSEIARKFGLRFYCARVDVRGYQKENRKSLEESARILRYRVLKRIRRLGGFDKIALAHHSSDQAETILLNLVRGTGMRGLGGMRAQRDNLIRPLLSFSKKSMSDYLLLKNGTWRQDESNEDMQYSRNFIRSTVIKPLENRFGDSVIHTLCRAGRAAQEAEVYIRMQAEEALAVCLSEKNRSEITLEIHSFLGYLELIQKYMVLLCAEALTEGTAYLSAHELEKILQLARCGRSGKQFKLSNSLTVMHTGVCLALFRQRPGLKPKEIRIGACLDLTEINGRIKIAKYLKTPFRSALFSRNPNEEFIDADLVGDVMTIRSFRPGDSFFPIGMKGHKKVKKYFIDEKIPVYRRKSIPLLCFQDKIVWIVGHRLDDRFKIKTDTKNVIYLSFRKELE